MIQVPHIGHVGFTGTRWGMTRPQRARLQDTLKSCLQRGAHTFHHGDCFGADEQAHAIAHALGYRICVHPPSIGKLRAYCQGETICDPLPYLERDRAIVQHADIVIASPKEIVPQRRSGTWYTWRYASQQGKETLVLLPN